MLIGLCSLSPESAVPTKVLGCGGGCSDPAHKGGAEEHPAGGEGHDADTGTVAVEQQ